MISDIDKDWTRILYRRALDSLSKVDPPWLALTELKKYSFHSRSRGTLQNLWGSAEVFDILILLIIKTSQKPPSPINLAGYLAAPLPSSKSEVAHRPTWCRPVLFYYFFFCFFFFLLLLFIFLNLKNYFIEKQ